MINNRNLFPSYVDANLKADKTFITDNRIASKRKKSYAGALLAREKK